MSNSVFGNARTTGAFAAIVIAVAVLLSLSVGKVLPADATEVNVAPPMADPTAPARRIEKRPVETGWSAAGDDGGWGAAALAAAGNGGGFASSTRSSGSGPFGTYRPDANQTQGSQPRAPTRSTRVLRLTPREANEMLVPRGRGSVAIAMRPRRAR